ncbi:MAG: flagellar basal body-associated FliL family protein [Rickettsiaceae bacterium]|nr:flagellar basal body-associated FliL family protein [Rickettsiaceae bacterium]
MAKNTDKFEEDEPLNPAEISESEEDESSDKKKKLKKLFLIVLPIIITIIGAVYFFFFIINAPKYNEEKGLYQTKEKEQVLLESNTYLDIDPITVGLTPSGNKKEYLKLDLTLRISTEQESAIILEKMPIIKDTLITFLRTLRATDFNSSSSAIYLKEEISKRINKITAPIVIKEVLFQEITVN